MVSSTAMQAWTVAVLALLRSRSALGSPHGKLPPQVYATDDAVTRNPGILPNATTADRDVRTDHGRHSSYDVFTNWQRDWDNDLQNRELIHRQIS